MNIALLLFVIGAVLAGISVFLGERQGPTGQLSVIAIGCISAGLAVQEA